MTDSLWSRLSRMERLMEKQIPAERREAVVIGREHDGTLLWVRERGVVREAEELTSAEREYYERARGRSARHITLNIPPLPEQVVLGEIGQNAGEIEGPRRLSN